MACENTASLTALLKAELRNCGADIVGFGDITELSPETRGGLPVGVSVAVKIPTDIVRGISELPTRSYFDFYNRANSLLDKIVTRGAEYLCSLGYAAIPQTRERVGTGKSEYNTLLPHKTVATRAGIGWIGKCALLVTEECGSMLRLSSILTDAPLLTGESIDESRCGNCTACLEACPAHAVSGKLWTKGLAREEFFNVVACQKAARERAMRGFGVDTTICGKCIQVCPFTQLGMKN
jgi:epoxyqueuosine reductase QueG